MTLRKKREMMFSSWDKIFWSDLMFFSWRFDLQRIAEFCWEINSIEGWEKNVVRIQKKISNGGVKFTKDLFVCHKITRDEI